MNILIILPYIPYPLNSGGNHVIFQMIDHQRTLHKVSLLFDASGHGANPKPNKKRLGQIDELRKIWPDVTFYVYEGVDNPEDSIPQNRLTKFYAFMSCSLVRKQKRSYHKWSISNQAGDQVRAESSICNRIVTPKSGFLRFIENTCKEGNFDVVQVEMYEYLFLGYILPENCKKVFIHHEIRFVRNESEMQLFKKQTPEDKITTALNRAIEIEALQQYDTVVTLSEHDRDTLLKFLPQTEVIASPPLFDIKKEQKACKPCKEFVFIGSGDHMPNREAMTWVVNEILPLMEARGFDAKIQIVGSWSKRHKQNLLNHSKGKYISFAGYIPDLGEFINQRISIVPVRIGSGIRIKILEAAGACSPIITTTKGVEGIPLENGIDCLIADSAHDFVDAMEKLLQDEKLQARLAQNSHDKIASYYNQKRLLTLRNKALEE